MTWTRVQRGGSVFGEIDFIVAHRTGWLLAIRRIDAPSRSRASRAWRDFNRRIRDNGSVGIFHETYRVPATAIETVYGNMPVFGLAEATSHVPVRAGSQSAAARLGVRADGDAPVEPY